MPVRKFNGTSDAIRTAAGGISIEEAFSLAALVKIEEASGSRALLNLWASSREQGAPEFWYEDAELGAYNNGVNSGWSGAAVAPADGWVLLVMTKAAGTVKPKFYKHVFSTSTLTHAEGNTALADPGVATTEVRIGQWSSVEEFFKGVMAAAAVWGTALTQAQVEELAEAASLEAWKTVGAPQALWFLDQASTEEEVEDLIGNADQTSVAGTTVVAEDPPIPYEAEEEPAEEEGGEEEPTSSVVAARVLSEPVDDTLFVKLTGADGRQGRLSGIEAEAGDIATGITYSNSAPGGHRSASMNLLRDPRRDFPDLNFIDDLVIYGRTKPLGRNVFEGMTEQFPAQLADTANIAVNAVGNQAMLSENEAWKALYVDLGASGWEEARLARKRYISEGFSIPQGKISLSSGEDGLVWTVPSGQTLAAYEDTEAFYRSAAGCEIGAVGYKGSRAKNWTNFEAAILYLSASEMLSSDYGSIGLTLDDTPRVVDVGSAAIHGTAPAAYRYAMLRASVAVAVTPEAGTQQTYPALAVYGKTGVPRRAIAGELPGVYAHDVLAHIISTGAPDLNYRVGGDGSIVPNTSFVMPDFAPTEGGKPSDAIEKLNAYFLNNWGVWDAKKFFWKPWNPEDLTWQVSIAGGAQWIPVGRQAPTDINGIVVEYDDAEGIHRTAGPPGSGSDYESALLVNPDPNNPYTRRGRRRWAKLSVGFPLAYPTTAFQVGSIVLAEAMLPQRSGQLRIKPRGAGHIPSVTHPTMGQLPIWPFRSGDHAMLMDWPVPEPLRVTEVNGTVDSKELVAQLDSGAARLTAILERSGSAISA